jgi:hypothetical protein
VRVESSFVWPSSSGLRRAGDVSAPRRGGRCAAPQGEAVPRAASFVGSRTDAASSGGANTLRYLRGAERAALKGALLMLGCGGGPWRAARLRALSLHAAPRPARPASVVRSLGTAQAGAEPRQLLLFGGVASLIKCSLRQRPPLVSRTDNLPEPLGAKPGFNHFETLALTDAHARLRGITRWWLGSGCFRRRARRPCRPSADAEDRLPDHQR